LKPPQFDSFRKEYQNTLGTLIAAFFLVFMPAFSELTMSVLLTGPGNETLGTLIFQLQEYGDASGSGAALLSFCV
jgi:ABC-type Fe3+ transport system permease subunit